MTMIAAKMERDPTRLAVMSREDCLTLLVTVHASKNQHVQAAEGYANNLFTVALDGEEDERRGSERALEIFRLTDMAAERRRLVADLEDDYACGRLSLTYGCMERLMEDFPSRGQLDAVEDGMEDELEHFWDGDPWQEGPCEMSDDEVDAATERPKRLKLNAAEAVQEPSANVAVQSGKDLVQAGSKLNEDEAQEAKRWAAQLEKVDQIIAQLQDLDDPAVVDAAKRARRRIQQRATGRDQTDVRIARAVRRAVENAELDRRLRQEEHARAQRELVAIKDARTCLRLQQEETARKDSALRDKISKEKRQQDIRNAATSYETKDFNAEKAGPVTATKNRWDAFRRVLLLADCLPAEQARALMSDFHVWDRGEASRYGARHPARFATVMERMLGLLQEGRAIAVKDWWLNEVNHMAKPRLVLPALPL